MLNSNLHDDDILNIEPASTPVATTELPPPPPSANVENNNNNENEKNINNENNNDEYNDGTQEEEQDPEVSSLDNVIPPNIQENLNQAKTKLNAFWMWGKVRAAYRSECAARQVLFASTLTTYRAKRVCLPTPSGSLQ